MSELAMVCSLLPLQRSASIENPLKVSFDDDVVSAIAREIHSIRQQLKSKDDGAKKYKEACRTLKVTSYTHSYAFCDESMSSINTNRCRVDSLPRGTRFGHSQRTRANNCIAHEKRNTMTERKSLVSNRSWIERVVCSATKVNNYQQRLKNRFSCLADDCLKHKEREMHDLKTKLQECDAHVADLDRCTSTSRHILCVLCS